MYQEKPTIHLKNFGTINFSKTHLLPDQISSEHTGTLKQPVVRPQSSQEANFVIGTQHLQF
jgi:hypothetical protein